MVSLLKFAEITEEGVKFESPHDGSEMMLTPEKSIEIQNSIGKELENGILFNLLSISVKLSLSLP